MQINYLLVTVIGLVLLGLIVFLIRRNWKDKKEIAPEPEDDRKSNNGEIFP